MYLVFHAGLHFSTIMGTMLLALIQGEVGQSRSKVGQFIFASLYLGLSLQFFTLAVFHNSYTFAA